MNKSILTSFFIIFLFYGCTTNRELDNKYISDNLYMRKNDPTMRAYKVENILYRPILPNLGDIFYGKASWYGPKFHGKNTSNGEVYDMYSLTAASKILPMNTVVEVTNLENKKRVLLRINDRGPFVKTRIIDLSREAADRLSIYKHGTAEVSVEVVGYYIKNIDKRYFTSNKKRVINTKYYIQMAAYKDIKKAMILKDKYIKRFSNTSIKKVFISGNLYYKVVIGSFSSSNRAKFFLASHLDIKNAFIYVE